MPIANSVRGVLGTTSCLFILSLTLIQSPEVLAAPSIHANRYHSNERESFYFTYEQAGNNDHISGIGASYIILDSFSHFGSTISSSLNDASITTEYGDIEEYIAWEASAKFGYFSDVSLYAEFGFDLAELLFHDFRYRSRSDDDNGDYCCEDQYEDNIDVYIGVGAGVTLGSLTVEAFYRIREIDSIDWESASREFSGIQLSLSF